VTWFVPGSISDTEAVNSFDTHTRPAVTATPPGPLPTGISPVTSFFVASIRETDPPRLLATQTAPLPEAIPVGP